MKHMKKISALLIALLIAVSMFTAAFAAEEPQLGSITINGIGSSTYEIYRLLDLESFDIKSGAYSYKVNADWAGFFTDIPNSEDGLDYVTIDADGYVTWKADKENEADVAAFAKLALAYAEANNINPVQSTDPEDEDDTSDMAIDGTKGVFSNLPLGYYLVDSTVGALCGLTTTNLHASINAKNVAPVLVKQVKEDSTNQYDAHNTADIGQTVEFRVTIDVSAGVQNYTLHDKMSEGLTFQEVTKIEHIIPGTGTHEMKTRDDGASEDNYTIKVADAIDTDNEYATPIDSACTFEIDFSDYICNKLQPNDKIVVYYTAMLNRDAVIAGAGNPKTAYLTYGEANKTTGDYNKTAESVTTTYTYAFDIVKTDSQNILLDGAKFRIYDAETEGNEVKVVLMDDGKSYRRARADEDGVDIAVTGGKMRVNGLDNGTYYLEETEAPKGYNKLSGRQRFIINNANLEAIFNGETYSTGSGVHVVNKTGSMLPETGGIGTTIFYAAGGILVAAAIVLLITRKRVNDK